MHRSVLQALMNITPAHITDQSTRVMLQDWQQQIHAQAHERGVASLLAQRGSYLGALVGKVLTDLTKTVQIYVAVYGDDDDTPPEPADAAETETTAPEDPSSSEPLRPVRAFHTDPEP